MSWPWVGAELVAWCLRESQAGGSCHEMSFCCSCCDGYREGQQRHFRGRQAAADHLAGAFDEAAGLIRCSSAGSASRSDMVWEIMICPTATFPFCRVWAFVIPGSRWGGGDFGGPRILSRQVWRGARKSAWHAGRA
jgi:hypothetical protein